MDEHGSHQNEADAKLDTDTHAAVRDASDDADDGEESAISIGSSSDERSEDSEGDELARRRTSRVRTAGDAGLQGMLGATTGSAIGIHLRPLRSLITTRHCAICPYECCSPRGMAWWTRRLCIRKRSKRGS